MNIKSILSSITEDFQVSMVIEEFDLDLLDEKLQ
jgi:hypothetical protein